LIDAMCLITDAVAQALYGLTQRRSLHNLLTGKVAVLSLLARVTLTTLAQRSMRALSSAG
jgi:hypothetical protein